MSSIANGEISIPIQRRASICAAAIVVPQPQNGSKTTSPGRLDALMMCFRIPTGFPLDNSIAPRLVDLASARHRQCRRRFEDRTLCIRLKGPEVRCRWAIVWTNCQLIHWLRSLFGNRNESFSRRGRAFGVGFNPGRSIPTLIPNFPRDSPVSAFCRRVEISAILC